MPAYEARPYLRNLLVPLAAFSLRRVQQNMAKRRDLRAYARDITMRNGNVERSHIADNRALLQLVQRTEGECRAETAGEASMDRRRNTDRYTCAVCKPSKCSAIVTRGDDKRAHNASRVP